MINQIAASIFSALNVDLPDITYKTFKGDNKTRRPYLDEVEVYVFPQTWGSTALGFGGIGGSAMTTAYTVVVIHNRKACVYFDGMFAYICDCVKQEFYDDLKKHEMVDVATAPSRY